MKYNPDVRSDSFNSYPSDDELEFSYDGGAYIQLSIRGCPSDNGCSTRAFSINARDFFKNMMALEQLSEDE